MGIEQNYLSTRMHSSRMRTARTLTIGGGVYLPRGVCLPRRCTCTGGVPAQGVYLPGGSGVPAQGGVPVQGGTCPGRVYLPGGYLPASPHGQNSWHTLLKILPCPKLRLRAVISELEQDNLCNNWVFPCVYCLIHLIRNLSWIPANV